MKKFHNIASISAFALVAMIPQAAYSQELDPDALAEAIGTPADGETPASGLFADIEDINGIIGTPADGETPATGLVADIEDINGIIGKPADGETPATGLVADIEDINGEIDRVNGIIGTPADGETPATGLVADVAGLNNLVGAPAGEGVEASGLFADIEATDTTVEALGESAANALGGGAVYDADTGVISDPEYTIQGETVTGVGGAMSAINDVLTDHGTRLDGLDTKVANLQQQQELQNRQANGGIAAAMALGGAMIVPDSTVSVNFNIATYRGEQGFAGNLTFRASERVYFNGGVVGSTVRGSTGGRVGVAFGF